MRSTKHQANPLVASHKPIPCKFRHTPPCQTSLSAEITLNHIIGNVFVKKSMQNSIWIGIEIKSYDLLSISKSRKAILAIDRYIKKGKTSKGSALPGNPLQTFATLGNLAKGGKGREDGVNSTFLTAPPQSQKKPWHSHSQSFAKERPLVSFARKEGKGFALVYATGTGKGKGNSLCEKRDSYQKASINQTTSCFVEPLPSHESFVSLPTKRKRYTVLRSPHIDKKSREHFEWKQNKVKVFLTFERSEEWGLFLFILGNARLPGVQLLISCQYSTFCFF